MHMQNNKQLLRNVHRRHRLIFTLHKPHFHPSRYFFANYYPSPCASRPSFITLSHPSLRRSNLILVYLSFLFIFLSHDPSFSLGFFVGLPLSLLPFSLFYTVHQDEPFFPISFLFLCLSSFPASFLLDQYANSSLSESDCHAIAFQESQGPLCTRRGYPYYYVIYSTVTSLYRNNCNSFNSA